MEAWVKVIFVNRQNKEKKNELMISCPLIYKDRDIQEIISFTCSCVDQF
jgi:ferredoxin-thioredoxin reductase catalytic subunit